MSAPLIGYRIRAGRNSVPRSVQVIPLGEHSARAVRGLADGRDNVRVDSAPTALDGTDMLILVHHSDDREVPPAVPLDAAPKITLVLLGEGAPDPGFAADLRRHADLVVATTDDDFVAELVTNLAA
jgi:hypothetical protein